MNQEELKHFGIKGMKWGIRRFQNEDGSLTPAGRERYGEDLYERYFMANHLLVYEDKGVYIRERFFNELSNRGYNMIRDDFDWHSSGGAANSVILFNGSASVQIDTEQILSKAMMKKVDKYWEAYGKKKVKNTLVNMVYHSGKEEKSKWH